MKTSSKLWIIIPSVIGGLVLIASMLLVFCPNLVAHIMRASFAGTNAVKPAGYEAMESAVVAHKDLEYTSEFGDNKLDLYLPKNANELAPLPIIIWVHGGAFVGGDKIYATYYATALSSNGYAVASMNYMRAPEAKYPTPIVQLGEVCEWLVSKSADYNLDPTRFVFAGDSAGAHIVSSFANVQTSPEYAELLGLTPTPIVPASAIKGMLLYCGPYDMAKTANVGGFFGFFLFRAAWTYFDTKDWANEYADKATLTQNITSVFPPTFITDSNTASFEDQGKELADALSSKGVSVSSYFMPLEFEKTSHEYQFDMSTPAGAECYARTLTFLADVL